MSSKPEYEAGQLVEYWLDGGLVWGTIISVEDTFYKIKMEWYGFTHEIPFGMVVE